MNIVHLICSFTTGGAELMLIDMINEQAAQGHAVKLIVINNFVDDKLVRQLDKRVIYVCVGRKPGSRNIFPLIYLNLLLCCRHIDVIHCHDSVIAGMLFPCFKEKMYLTVHTVGVQSKYFNRYKSIIAISNSVKEDIQSRTSICPVLINNGVVVSKIKQKRNNGEPMLPLKVIIIGRLEHLIKGQHIVIEALHRMGNRATDFRVDMVGDGSSKVYLQSLVASYGLEKIVRFLGLKARSFVYEHLSEYDILVQPSISEGFGLTVAEAMIAKVPVIVSGVGPVEIIEHGRWGYYFEGGNVEQCAERLQSMLDNYKSLDIEGAFLYAKDHYSLERMVREYDKMYKCKQ